MSSGVCIMESNKNWPSCSNMWHDDSPSLLLDDSLSLLSFQSRHFALFSSTSFSAFSQSLVFLPFFQPPALFHFHFSVTVLFLPLHPSYQPHTLPPYKRRQIDNHSLRCTNSFDIVQFWRIWLAWWMTDNVSLVVMSLFWLWVSLHWLGLQ